MLLLAQVQAQFPHSPAKFRVLARQHVGASWVVLDSEEMLTCARTDLPNLMDSELYLQTGQLVLLHLSEIGKVQALEDVVPLILNFMRTDRSSGLTPELAQAELARAEEWRQTLTLQTQELSRSRVEIETRRVQIQQIEEALKLERQELDLQRLEMEARMSELKALELASQKSNTP